MATAAVLPPNDIHTTLNYYAPIGSEAPFQYVYGAPEGEPSHNIGTNPQPAVIHDTRGRESEYTLDKNGFQFIHWPSVEKDFVDEDAIKTKYYAEVEALLKEVAGAKRVFIFDHTIR